MKLKSKQVAFVIAGFLGISMVGPMNAQVGAPQHHDQAPGYYRLKVGDIKLALKTPFHFED
jgi:hypothetical protein